MNITVTQEHIARGKPGNCYLCPIAIAITEWLLEHDEPPNVEVTPFAIYIEDREYSVPIQVSRIIEDYDDGTRMSPFSFTLLPRYPDLKG